MVICLKLIGLSLKKSENVCVCDMKQVRVVSVKAEHPNHPSHSHARQGVVVGSQLWGGGGGGGGGLVVGVVVVTTTCT